MKQREKITEEFIELMKDPELRALMQKALDQAHEQNPDHISNPAFTLEELYDFIDWSCRCLPWECINTERFSTLYDRVDQSLNYFWFVFGQYLDELKDKGYYIPTLEYHEPIATWIKKYSIDWGRYLSSEESWNDEQFEKQLHDSTFGMDKGWYSTENIWHSYNEFFSRRLIDPGVRPIGEAELVSPADSRPEGFFAIKADGYIEDEGVQIKGHKFYTVDDLLHKKEYAGLFHNGTLTHTFLSVRDYHRYHFPIDGKIIDMYKIDAFNAVGGHTHYDPEEKCYTFICSDSSWQARETRDCVILDTKFGHVACLPIGMSQVCSCNFEEDLKIGDEVRKGDPMGYFLFGGSDFVMVFESKVEVTPVAQKDKHILMGEDYAKLKLK